MYRVTTGHQGSCRVSTPLLRVGVSRVTEFWRRAGSCWVIVMGNVARPGFAGSGVWPVRAGSPSMAGSGCGHPDMYMYIRMYIYIYIYVDIYTYIYIMITPWQKDPKQL